jgi:hypothetical protein
MFTMPTLQNNAVTRQGKVFATYLLNKWTILLIHKELLKINKKKSSNQKSEKNKECEQSSEKTTFFTYQLRPFSNS